MDRCSWLVVLGAGLLLGCGKSKSPLGPAPAFQPPANTAAPPAQTEESAKESAPSANDDNVAEEMPAEEKEKMAIDAPAEASPETPLADAKAEQPAKHDAATEAPATNDEAAPATAGKSKGSAGKLFRGLGNSLSRALAKIPSADAPIETRREPPKLDDDPFPKGEPVDDKPHE